MSTILQQRLAFAPWADPRTRRLPGTIPVTEAEWLLTDDAFAAQMALRDDLIATRPGRVHALHEDARPAAAELYRRIMRLLPDRGYDCGPAVRRPDGVLVLPDPQIPLMTLGRFVAEDLCLMIPGPDGRHVLGGAILCFPAGWSLSQKFMRPMMRIHRPVASYTEDIGRRVQRLLDGLSPGPGLMRGTAHHSDAPLHHPLTEEQDRIPPDPAPFIRVERQCLFRLPETGAVVFSIHTSVIRPEALDPDQRRALRQFPIRHGT